MLVPKSLAVCALKINPILLHHPIMREPFCLAQPLPMQLELAKNSPVSPRATPSGIARKLASFGYGVVAMDHPAFGLSESLNGYILNFDKLVDIEHFLKVKEKPELRNLPSFLFGESTGGNSFEGAPEET